MPSLVLSPALNIGDTIINKTRLLSSRSTKLSGEGDREAVKHKYIYYNSVIKQ